MTFKDADGREWVLVPRDATAEMVAAADNRIGSCQGRIFGLEEAINYALAAAPQFVPQRVADEVANRVFSTWFSLPGISPSGKGRDMIAAVQQVLGPQFGLVPREWVEDAYREGAATGLGTYDVQSFWKDSAARKRIEGSGNG